MNKEGALSIFGSCSFEEKAFKNVPNPSIPSDSKANPDEKIQENRSCGRRSRGRGIRKTRNKSVSDLEAEELRGFMDLGLVSTEEHMIDPGLVEILPGLRRFLGGEAKSSEISRPYLSESWEYYDDDDDDDDDWRRRRRSEIDGSLFLNVRVGKECCRTDMEDILRCWARSIASVLK